MTAEAIDHPRPDPAQGVFETTLVVAGRALELDAHLTRMESSLSALYGLPLPAGARELVAEGAAGTELGRLRLTVVPDPDGAAATATVKAVPVDEALVFPGWAGAVELAPVAVAGGIGAHKWADRRLLGHAESATDPALPLIVDSDGTLLEGSRGSLFVVTGGVLLTPAADGRLLPGITRAQVIQAARGLGMEVREEALGPDRLADADEAFMTGAVRGVEPVRRYAGVRDWEAGEVTTRVAAELRRIWGLN
ncbi:MAG: para-aminobenzoate synthetase / 4-amino-4-deoxychorismate lyase [Thermoleophilaceae bacterium]|jgi:para-aminobenzoate synthetase/4-amino-4-deoxychorismate lyase|nr:para-aminobenzoate synthetase / 4-amino-4-deoxychorismate lyase [Thermoleophilaceae bacterium]